MNEIASILLSVAIPVFAVFGMLSVGFRYTAREILGPLRDITGVITAIIANFVLVRRANSREVT